MKITVTQVAVYKTTISFYYGTRVPITLTISHEKPLYLSEVPRMSEIPNPNLYSCCNCTPRGEEILRHTGWVQLTASFYPGCPLCAACTCQACEIDPSLEDKWSYFVAYNISCDFCYARHPERHLYEELHAADGCGSDAGSVNEPPAIYATEIEYVDPTERKREKLRKLGRPFLQRIEGLWKKKPNRDGKMSRLRRALTFATARRGVQTR